jgi:Mg2+-importing ATPase
VGEDQIAQPRPWHLGEITRFILFIGPISSVFDYLTFFVMLRVFGCWDIGRASLFQTGWFVESLVTQTLIIHIIRTNKLPFIEGRASWPLTATTLVVMAMAAWLPYSPIAGYLGFTPLPAAYWPFLIGAILGYILLTQWVKTWLVQRKWL